MAEVPSYDDPRQAALWRPAGHPVSWIQLRKSGFIFQFDIVEDPVMYFAAKALYYSEPGWAVPRCMQDKSHLLPGFGFCPVLSSSVSI